MLHSIKEIDFETIYPIWENYLWPNRSSAIESRSAMIFNSTDYSIENMSLPVWFFGEYQDSTLIGVSSCHLCNDGTFRFRGFWVDNKHRKRGTGTRLLNVALDKARQNNSYMMWSYPRKSSWNIHARLGFIRKSEWHKSETSDENCFAFIYL